MSNFHQFIHPFTAIVAGPTGCGKTEFIYNLLLNNKDYIQPSPTKIYYYYSIWQDKFTKMKDKLSNIHFYEGLTNFQQVNRLDNNLIIIDDLMKEASDNNEILDMFTKGSHHSNCSIIVLTQNIFNKGKHSRTMSLNSHYIVLFKNPRDATQISFLSRQMYPKNSKFLEEAYHDATNEPYGYLLIDLKQATPNEFRVQSNIFSKERHYFYLKNN